MSKKYYDEEDDVEITDEIKKLGNEYFYGNRDKAIDMFTEMIFGKLDENKEDKDDINK